MDSSPVQLSDSADSDQLIVVGWQVLEDSVRRHVVLRARVDGEVRHDARARHEVGDGAHFRFREGAGTRELVRARVGAHPELCGWIGARNQHGEKGGVVGEAEGTRLKRVQDTFDSGCPREKVPRVLLTVERHLMTQGQKVRGFLGWTHLTSPVLRIPVPVGVGSGAVREADVRRARLPPQPVLSTGAETERVC